MNGSIQNKNGMTLIELMVAMVVASIALSLVFYMWNNINTHISKSEYKSQIESETNRISLQIVNQIRKSPSIIEWNSNRIQMVNGVKNDTLDYYFDESDLKLNGQPVTLLVKNAKVTQFEFIDKNENSGIQSNSLLLEFTLTIVGRETDTSTVHNTIQVSQNVNKDNGTGSAFGF